IVMKLAGNRPQGGEVLLPRREQRHHQPRIPRVPDEREDDEVLPAVILPPLPIEGDQEPMMIGDALALAASAVIEREDREVRPVLDPPFPRLAPSPRR